MSCVSDPTPYAGSCIGTVGVPIRWESIHTGLRAAATRRQVPSCETAALLWVCVHLGEHLHVRVYLLLPFLMLMAASVLGGWGFFTGLSIGRSLGLQWHGGLSSHPGKHSCAGPGLLPTPPRVAPRRIPTFGDAAVLLALTPTWEALGRVHSAAREGLGIGMNS